jgi:hypothetical protein
VEPGERKAAPLRIRFEVPRAELERAESALAALDNAGKTPPADFDREHLRGRLTLTVGVPFLPDPMLDFLRRERGLKADPPVEVALDQPVAYVVGQMASATVLALYGEGEFSVPLSGGRGALSLAAVDGQLHVGAPLESYAAVAPVPPAEGARAIAAACGALADLLRGRPGLSRWALTAFLEREGRILESAAAGKGARQPPLPPVAWRADAFAEGKAPTLAEVATAAERGGSHVVPYWRAAGGERRILFEPLRAPGNAARAGALALCIAPDGEALLEVELHRDDPGAARLRNRLKRRAPFSATFRGGKLEGIVEASNQLPMA